MKWKTKELGYAFPKTVPVLAGYLVLGAAYGMLMAGNGYGPFWSVLISVVVYAGSLQYLGVSLLVSGVNPLYGFVLSFMLNARHLFYGISMLDKYKNVKKFKPYLIFALTDETFSVLCGEVTPSELDRDQVYFWIAFLDHCYWVLGTWLGAMLGNALTFNTAGMDFALTAVFVVIFVGQWSEKSGRKPAILGGGAAVLCLLLFGEDQFIIPAMAVMLAVLFFVYNNRKVLESKEKEAV